MCCPAGSRLQSTVLPVSHNRESSRIHAYVTDRQFTLHDRWPKVHPRTLSIASDSPLRSSQSVGRSSFEEHSRLPSHTSRNVAGSEWKIDSSWCPPFVDSEDQDYFVALDTARGFAPDSAIMHYAPKRRQTDQAPSFDQIRFQTQRWLILDHHPLRAGESEAFRALIEDANRRPGCIPGRRGRVHLAKD
ncbi:hypothetical protein K440DRAFT_675264 [Wilcoxina mikolae CBS 423.85]|nr:hypothetical protein K440DRAFT_675264 [Wilcoxina mikolae CBS 423.85]